MTKIIFSEYGQGFPVIFLHGFGETKELWQSFLNRLSTKYRAIAPDLPGFGKSPLLKKEFSLDDVAAEVNKWIEGMNIQECIMIGHSMGGYITLAFAKRYPQKIKGIGLFHSSVFEDTPEKKEIRDKVTQFIKKNGVTPYMENFVPDLFYSENQTRMMEVIRRQVEVGSSANVESLSAYLAAMKNREDSAAFIKVLDKPVLMIIGRNDPSVPYETSMEQAGLLKQPHMHLLEETGHMGMFEHEKETLIYVEKFVDHASKL